MTTKTTKCRPDSRGPFRTIASVVQTPEANLVTYEECGHTGTKNRTMHFKVGEQVRCFACGEVELEAWLARQGALTVDEAAAAVRAGGRVKVTVGAGDEDPVLEVYVYDGMVMSTAVAGWSAGTVEPVCALGSDYLTDHLLADRELELLEAAPVWTLKDGETVAGVFEQEGGALVVQVEDAIGRGPLDIAAGETACREVREFIETNGYGWRKA